MFNKIRLGPKLIGSFLFMALGVAVVGGVGVFGARSLRAGIVDIGENNLTSVTSLLATGDAQTSVDSAENALLYTKSSAEERSALYKKMEGDLERAEKSLKTFEPLPQTPDEEKIYKEFVPVWKAWVSDHNKYIELAKKYGEDKTDDSYAKMAQQALVENYKTFDASNGLLDKLVSIIKENAESESKSLMQTASNVIFASIIITVIAVVTALVLGILISRSIASPMGNLQTMFSFVAQGRLKGQKVETDAEDEIGDTTRAANSLVKTLQNLSAFVERVGNGDLRENMQSQHPEDEISAGINRMVDSLRELVGKALNASSQVNTGAGQVSSASQSLSQGAVEQASALEQVSSSVNELTSQVLKNASSADEANLVAIQARDSATRGNSQIEQTVEAMTEISRSSKDISKIIKVIDDIAFQTNLLALNAAVEAARAGKHGKGFAVVADEVRNLAGRSATAAKEVNELISSSGQKVENGLKEASQTADSFKEIVNGAVKVAELVGQISTASGEQASSLEQISQGVNQVSQATQEASASAEETASAAEELLGQATDLQQLMSRFRM